MIRFDSRVKIFVHNFLIFAGFLRFCHRTFRNEPLWKDKTDPRLGQGGEDPGMDANRVLDE